MGDNFDILNTFFVVGINYKKSDAGIRGQFSINQDQYRNILSKSSDYNVKELLILSTCNRTEIFGFTENANNLINLLCSETQGSLETFTNICYIKNNIQAIQHFYDVAAGLDSQILGDYEIVGQIRMAAKFSKANNGMGSYMERLSNEVMASSKKIRTKTCMSGGTVSVSFAAVQYIREADPEKKKKNILLVGTGKFGCNTCKNLVDYLPGYKITLINRTEEKAKNLAEAHKLNFRPIEELQECIDNADIIIVATTSDKPIICDTNIKKGSCKILIDLSMPANICLSVKTLPGIKHIGIDELSKIKDDTLQKRSSEIPRAKEIIKEHINSFLTWNEMRKNVPVLKAVRITLQNIHIPDTNCTTSPNTGEFKFNSEDKIQKVINEMAIKMKRENRKGCNYIEAINDYISHPSN
ncbi:MAG: glutamyl-tRNA reductase [Ferruginibacter sp.]